MPASSQHTLPTIQSMSDMVRVLKKWQTQLNPLLKTPGTSPAPLNFSATRARGGILLAWARVNQADGYIVQRSDNGDFSNPINIPVQNGVQTSYFDTLGGTAGSTAVIQKWYRIRATRGTAQNPQSVLGILSGIVTTSSIDPTDTTTPATVATDVSTTDRTQTSASRGRISSL